MSGPHFELLETVEQRAAVYWQMERCGLLRINMHAWARPTLADWLDMTEPGDCDVWSADGWGVYYLTRGLGEIPFAHFAVWPEARGEAEKFLRAALAHGFAVYNFGAVLGLTPAKFRHVFPLLMSCGFEVLARLPGAVSLYGKPADGVLSIIRRR